MRIKAPTEIRINNSIESQIIKYARVYNAIKQAQPGVSVVATKTINTSATKVLNNKYIANVQAVDFGRVTSTKTKTMHIYKLKGVAYQSANLTGIDQPLTLSQSQINLRPQESIQVALTIKQGQAAVFNKQITIGQTISVVAKFGLLIYSNQAYSLATKINFKTAVNQSIDGTEERTPLLEAPVLTFTKVIEIPSNRLQSALSQINTAKDSAWLLPHGDTIKITVKDQSNAILDTGIVAQGDLLTFEQVGKYENEIIEISEVSGSLLKIKNYESSEIWNGAKQGKKLYPFKIISIDNISTDGNITKIQVTTKLLQ